MRWPCIRITPLGRLIAQYLITPSDERERTPEEWLCAWGIGDPRRYRGGMLGFIPHLPEPFRTVYLLGERSIGEQRSLEPERFSRTTLQWLKMNGIQTVADINIEAIDPLQPSARYLPDSGDKNPCRSVSNYQELAGR